MTDEEIRMKLIMEFIRLAERMPESNDLKDIEQIVKYAKTGE
jgi:hypothetical protein